VPPRVYAFHKPRGVLSSRVSEAGARPLPDVLPATYRAWFAVGRLDKDSEGLLLLSDDARFAQALMDPGGVEKVYEVVVEGFPSEVALSPLRAGGTSLDGRVLRPVRVERLGKAPRGGTRYRVTLSEGVNREIRRLFRAIGHRVRRLVRVAVGPVALGDLAPGEGRELAPVEVDTLTALVGWRHAGSDAHRPQVQARPGGRHMGKPADGRRRARPRPGDRVRGR
jgi:pseudouridine synthase